jgi:hypothetical protein
LVQTTLGARRRCVAVADFFAKAGAVTGNLSVGGPRQRRAIIAFKLSEGCDLDKQCGDLDSVTMAGRKVGKHDWVRVPVCLLCSIGGIKHYHYPRSSDLDDWYEDPHWQRTRCLGCGRLLRIRVTSWRGTLHRSECSGADHAAAQAVARHRGQRAFRRRATAISSIGKPASSAARASCRGGSARCTVPATPNTG